MTLVELNLITVELSIVLKSLVSFQGILWFHVSLARRGGGT